MSIFKIQPERHKSMRVANLPMSNEIRYRLEMLSLHKKMNDILSENTKLKTEMKTVSS